LTVIQFDDYEVVLGYEFLIGERVVPIPHWDRLFILWGAKPVSFSIVRAILFGGARMTVILVAEI